MTSKERFDAAVSHCQPDKIVVDFGSTAVTGIHVLAVENLRKILRAETWSGQGDRALPDAWTDRR